jgi:16S rRNA (guanine(966)-N(2))-methyltransferase RsmD
LATVRGPIRPTSALVREAIFNILGEEIRGARVLDLFSGTGALGIEALSRGAKTATFVEQNNAALQVLQKNLENCGLQEVSRVISRSVSQGLKQLAARPQQFDLIFLDPPYGRGSAAAALELLANSGVTAPGSRIVLEHSRQEELAASYLALSRVDERRYGDTVISFYRNLES